MLDHPDYHKYDPCRSKSWRMDVVIEMLARQPRPGRCSRHADNYVRTLRRFLLAWRNRSHDGRAKLYEEYPGLYYAYELETKHEKTRHRHTLQARLLTGQDDETIAKEVETIPQVVEWYEACFFNVRDRLHAHDWVANEIIAPAYARDVTATEDYTAMKLFGYYGGHIMLDFIISFAQKRGMPKCAGEEEIKSWLDKNWSETIRLRSTQQAKTFEINKYNVLELLATHARIIEIEKSAELSGEAQNQTEKNIAAMLQEFPWAVGEVTSQGYDETNLIVYDEGAAELSDTQMLQVGAGIKTMSIEGKELKQLPPPRKKEEKDEPE